MEKNNFPFWQKPIRHSQFSILSFSLILLLLAAACHSPHNNDNNPFSVDTVFVDSLNQSRDSKSDSWLPDTATNDQIPNHACDSILKLPVNRLHIDLLLEQTIYKKELKAYTLKALEWSEDIAYTDGVMNALDQLGVMERNMSNFAEALYFHNRCLTLSQLQQADHWLMRSYINLGVVYRRIDEYETALQYFLNAFPLAEKLENEKEISSCLGNIGTLYLSLNKLDEAMEYFRKSLYKAVEQNNYQGLAISHGSMGRVYENWGMLDSAQYCYERNLFYSEGWNDDNGIAISYSSLGNVAKKRGDWEKALEYYRKALEISLKFGDKNYIAPNYASLGEVYLHLGNMELSETNYLQSLLIAREAGLKRSMISALGGLSELYERQNRIKEALQATRQQTEQKDSVLNEENLRRIELLKIAYEVRQKELEIERQQHIITRQNMQRQLLAVGVAVCVVFLALLWYMLHLRIRRNLALTERNDVLSEMNATKDKFFNIISHDLKNPAIALNNNLKLLVSNVHVWNAKTLADFSNELLKSTEGQIELLNSLLNWARIQTGRITCNPIIFDLAVRLRNDILLVRKMAENKGIKLIFQIPDDVPVNGDSNMLVTIIRNLLTNAIKFTEPDGTVTLTVSSVSPYIVSVTDTGTGMSEEQIENLFRLDKPQTRRGTAGEEGSGLGLIVCKELLAKHNSYLHVESEKGKGSRFWFTI